MTNMFVMFLLFVMRMGELYILDLTEQYIRKIVKHLKDGMFIERVGARKNGFWKVK